MSRLNNVIVFLIIFSLSLNEFYHESYGRILDYFAIILIFIYFFLDRTNRIILKSDFSIFIFFIPYIIWGFINFKFLPSLAVLLGVSLITIFTKNVIRTCPKFLQVLDLVLKLHIAAFLIQIFFFYILKIPFSYIDFFPSLQQSRVYNEVLNLLRPGGFMMEPNSYSANMLMLVFVSYKTNKNQLTKPALIALITIPFTTSLWGIAFLLLLVFLRSKFIYKIFFILVFIISASVIYNTLENSVAFERVIRIMEDPTSDNSIVTRLGLETKKTVNPINIIFGNGINSTDFQLFLGGNGISYTIYCFGILGTILLFSWVLLSNGYKIFILFIFFHLTFPYYSYLIFWFFLAAALQNARLFSLNKNILANNTY